MLVRFEMMTGKPEHGVVKAAMKAERAGQITRRFSIYAPLTGSDCFFISKTKNYVLRQTSCINPSRTRNPKGYMHAVPLRD